jgi:hypothetical protein
MHAFNERGFDANGRALRCGPRLPLDLWISTQQTVITRWPSPRPGPPHSKITIYGWGARPVASRPTYTCWRITAHELSLIFNLRVV